MSEITIPINVPVYISNFKEEKENTRYSKAKLKIFYKGCTPDKRLFTERFSDKVIKTIYSTPVVAFYDEDKEDFVGHNNVQYSYGHVPENAEVKFEKDENDIEWAITDVILYTEREDNIGEVARKIQGKQHSLEFNPETLKYKINRDIKGNFKNLEFLDGEFIGLSVLGDDETPAFSGSEFFKTLDLDNNNREVKKNIDNFVNNLQKERMDIKVDLNNFKESYFAKLPFFLNDTIQDKIAKIYSALSKLDIYAYICELADDFSYVVVDYWKDETHKYLKFDLSFNDTTSEYELSNQIEGRMRFVPETEPNFSEDENAKKKCGNSEEQKAVDPEDKEEDKKDETDVKEDPEDKDEDNEDNKDFKETGIVSNNAEQQTAGQDTAEFKENKELEQAKTSSSIASLTDEEREELNRYRLERKQKLISDYEADMDSSILENFKNKLDAYSYDELNSKLAIEFRKFSLANKNKNTPTHNYEFKEVINDNYDDTNFSSIMSRHKK